MKRTSVCVIPMLIALYHPFCTPRVQSTMKPWDAPLAEFWQRPKDLASQDLLYGPWGSELAPDPEATYTFVARKQHGTNPGVIVLDAAGREWHVKQPPHNDQGAEGPIEVTLSRVLSAVGYHQPPVYFMPVLSIADAKGRTHVEPGGRFRLDEKSIKHTGTWSWQQNPFVGMRPYQGLLVMLLMFDSSDLKNDNNALYDVTQHFGVERWYVVRDLGTALGETGRLAPKRGDPDIFEREAFITGVKDGFVQFNYHGWHQELFNRITPEDVAFATEWLGRLSARQWSDAFRAGGFEAAVADRFIGRLHQKIAEGQRIAETVALPLAAPQPVAPLAIAARP